MPNNQKIIAKQLDKYFFNTTLDGFMSNRKEFTVTTISLKLLQSYLGFSQRMYQTNGMDCKRWEINLVIRGYTGKQIFKGKGNQPFGLQKNFLKQIWHCADVCVIAKSRQEISKEYTHNIRWFRVPQKWNYKSLTLLQSWPSWYIRLVPKDAPKVCDGFHEMRDISGHKRLDEQTPHLTLVVGIWLQMRGV